MDWSESLVERRIREAVERGDFDDLPGAGKPLDLRDAGDPEWWIKRYVSRERIDPAAVLPAALALCREAESFPASLADLTAEEQVRAVLTDFNTRVAAEWRRPVRGAGPPLSAYQVDVDALVEQWRATRPVPVPPPVSPLSPAEGPGASAGSVVRRRWGRRLLSRLRRRPVDS